MKHKKTVLGTAIATLVGTAGMMAPMAASAIIPDGNYRMVINQTPYVGGGYQMGSNGAWESSFTFGNFPKGSTSQAMYDLGDVHPSPGAGGVHPLDPNDLIPDGSVHPVVGFGFADGSADGGGSGILGDGVAGVIDITVTGNSFTVNTFNKDVILRTAGGSFFQFLGVGGVSQMSGAITGSDVVLDLTGRLGSVNQPVLPSKRWLVDDCEQAGCAGVGADGLPISTGNTEWSLFSTMTATNSTGVVNGTPLADLGDVSGTAPAPLGFASDNRADYSAVLVTGGWIGSDWRDPNLSGPGFFGAQFFEIWNVTFYSLIQANDDAASTSAGVAVNVSFQANDTTPFMPFVVDNISATANGGTVLDNGDGTLTYTPAGGFTGTDTFTYTVSDADPGADSSNPLTYTSQATVTVTVNSVGIPNANDDPAATDQNTSVAVNVLNNDDSGGGGLSLDATSVVASAGSNGGTVVDAVTGVVTYTPNTDFVGVDTFTYTVANDVPNTSNTATVTVTVGATSTSSAGAVTQGTVAAGAGVSGVVVTAAELGSADAGVDQQCVGGCFDFVVTGLGVGATINVFLPPLATAIPVSDPVTGITSYRKLQGATWVDFDLANVASSGPNAFGACSSNAVDYTAGLNAGDNCLMLTLTDGSVAGGDSDGAANGTITDPGGVGIAAGAGVLNAPSQGNFDSTDGQGCTLGLASVDSSGKADWWLIAGFLAFLGWKKRRKFTA